MKAYFAGGCFWCITPAFRIRGVDRVISGYSGGREKDPAYEDVKAQKTGHRETVCIDYDPELVTYGELLDVFLANVDPFDPDGQYIDRGRSYTLAVYTASEEERALAASRIRELEERAGRTVCVALEPFDGFWEAEEYHQDFDLRHPEELEKEMIESGRKTDGG